MDKIKISNLGDLDAYWGVELCSMSLEVKDLSLTFDLKWTDSGSSCSAYLTFESVSQASLLSTSLSLAERIELISIEAKTSETIEVSCEMSNFELDFKCSAIFLSSKIKND